jgi:hypothetical protein
MSLRTRPHAVVARRVAAPAAALLIGLLAATGCGAADPDDGGTGDATVTESGPSTTPSGSTGSTSSSDAASQAVSLTYHKTGGLRPTDETLLYSEDGPRPDGVTAAEVDQVLTAASNPELRDLQLEPMPKYPCCDLQEYTVTISYADGSSESFRTVDGVQQPELFENLLSMLG